MKRIDYDRYMPLGWDSAKTLGWLAAGLSAAGLWSLWCFLGQYQEQYRELFYYGPAGQKLLISGQSMAPFYTLLTYFEVGFSLVLMAMPVLAGLMYLHHWRDSRSIYLMRRLPDPWELHRRCLTVPVLGAVAALGLQGLACGMCYLFYILCTPARCLPV